jgi:Fe-S cluster assembly protein SufD
MEIPNIRYITESTDLVYHVGRSETWKGYFIVGGKQSMDISISCFLEGEYADASIHIVNVLSGGASVNLKTVQHHTTKNARSIVLVKTVVTDTASFVFDGTIVVAKDADKTDAYQRNENLILSDSAKIVSHPTLEILASDVRCTHGAATGPIPSDGLWYLMTRGLSLHQAQKLYVQGFIASALDDVDTETNKIVMHRIMDI